jgi:hypothetical protein
MQLYHSKDMSVHVVTCTSYDFNILMPVVWELCVSVYHHKNSDQFYSSESALNFV